MKPRVFFLFLDAADVRHIEHYCQQGILPTFERLIQSEQFSHLNSLEHSLAESVQVSCFIGSHPDKHGFHGPHVFDPVSYANSMDLLSAFNQVPPFYDFGDEVEVLAFDLPQCPLLKDRAYTQIIGWGAHGFAVGGQACPDSAWDDLITNVGLHPEYGIDYALLASPDSLDALFKRQIEGLKVRSKATRYLLDKYPWQFAITSSSELHTGAHYLLRHSGNEAFYKTLKDVDPVAEIYRATDQYLADMLEHVGADTEILIASVEGMSSNHNEVPNIAFLPEMMFRYSFPGEKMLHFDRPPPGFPEDATEEEKANWVVGTYRYAVHPGRAQQWLRKWFPEHLATRLEGTFGLRPAFFPAESRTVMNYQPTVWMEPYWPHMRAFALPTFSDGFVRLNVQGRESKGKVAPEDFRTECDRICNMLESYISDKTQVPGIDHIERVRDTANQNPEATPADLIVFWKEHPMGKLTSSDYGNIGPLPALRAGVHNPNAFVIGSGPRISSAGIRDGGHIFDLSATVYDLLGKKVPDHIQGHSLLNN